MTLAAVARDHAPRPPCREAQRKNWVPRENAQEGALPLAVKERRENAGAPRAIKQADTLGRATRGARAGWSCYLRKRTQRGEPAAQPQMKREDARRMSEFSEEKSCPVT